MDKYFYRFPVVNYGNTNVLDISRHVVIDEPKYDVPNLFYPVELLAGVRPDTIADAYYEDAELDWLIYHSNHIVDPYFQWYLDESDFIKLIIDKYVSIDEANQRIKYWRNNWYTDDTELSPSFYDNNLAYEQKQYYSPVFGEGAKITAYKRKQADWITNTNKLIRYDITYVTGNSFTVGELLYVHAGDNINAEVGGGSEVVAQNSTHITVMHVTGNSEANTTWTKTFEGRTSGTVATTNLANTIQENITNAEADFWTTVSYYEWETEQNEAKKHIYVLNPSMTRTTSAEISRKLNE